MKKTLLFSLIVIITICIMGNSYATPNCNIQIQASKIEVKKNEEFTVNVNISNIQSERGIISMGGTLEYDKDSLGIVKIEGKNGWETPTDGASYNAANGKIAITRSGLGKNDETIFTVTFKVKETSKQNLLVGMKDISVADGTKPIKIAQTYQNITVIEGTSNPVPTPTPDEPTVNPTPNPDNKPSTNTQPNSILGGNTNNNKDTNSKNITKSQSLPKAGGNTMILGMFIAVVIIIAIVFFIKMRLLNKKMEK